MTTALDLIKGAMQHLSVISIGEEPSAEDAEVGLIALNNLLDSWSNDNLMIYAKTLDTIPLIANQQSVTVGPTGSFVTTRPVFVDAASYIVFQNVTYMLQKWTLTDYNSLVDKAVATGIPTGFFPAMNFPDIQITFAPIPSQAMTFMLWSNKQITTVPLVSTVINLPPGYKLALESALAENIASKFQVPIPSSVSLLAARSRRALTRTNSQAALMQMPYGIPGTQNYYGGFW